MTTCTSCSADSTGKNFCQECGTPVQPIVAPIASGQPSTCPHCSGEINPGSAFCMHCGSSLRILAATPAQPLTHPCPACRTEIALESAFCTNCGQNTRVSTLPPSFCTNCGQQNDPGVHFCATCGTAIGTGPQGLIGAPQAGNHPVLLTSGPYVSPTTPSIGQPASMQQDPYMQQPQQYEHPQYPQQPQQYSQPQYPQQYGQIGYQPEPMLAQQPMVLRCPVCMAMAQMGTTNCTSCHTSLAGIVPTPANAQGQQGGLSSFLL